MKHTDPTTINKNLLLLSTMFLPSAGPAVRYHFPVKPTTGSRALGSGILGSRPPPLSSKTDSFSSGLKSGSLRFEATGEVGASFTPETVQHRERRIVTRRAKPPRCTHTTLPRFTLLWLLTVRTTGSLHHRVVMYPRCSATPTFSTSLARSRSLSPRKPTERESRF